MKFSKVVGKIDPSKVKKAEEKLSSVFVELSLSYDNKSPGSGLGGDPFIFTLVYPIEQICIDDGKITTAATDGKRYYWNPDFVISLSRIGLRFVVAHEAFHAIYMHPSRRGGRLPKLWNIAVDYIVNYNIMCDLKQRQFDPVRMFRDNLGKYIELKAYADVIAGRAKWPKPKAGEDDKCFFADPALPEDLRKPEAIYEYLYSQMEKCPKCGKLQPKGTAQKQKEKEEKEKNGEKNGDQDGDQESDKGKKGKKGKSKSKDGSDGDKGEKGEKGKKGKKGQKGKGEEPSDESSDDHEHGDEGHDCGHDHDHGEGGEGDEGDDEGEGQGHSCDNHGDPFGDGGLVDDHLDSDMSQEDLAKRLADASEISRRLAGKIPAGLEDELGELLAPKLTWQDFIRMKLTKAREGNGRNDWNRFRTRPLASGMLVPKRKDYFANFGVLLDTSGSMDQASMALGISQLQSIDARGEGTITPADCSIYWKETVKIKKANREELSKVRVVGRGGTAFAAFFDEYEKEIGKKDFLIIISDGFLLDDDVRSMKKPSCEVYWVITNGHRFNPPFGRVFQLGND